MDRSRYLLTLSVALGAACGSGIEPQARLEISPVRQALTSSCSPYFPTTGLFLNTQNMLNVPSFPVTYGNYQISQSGGVVQVTRAGTTVFSTSLSSGEIAAYLFFPSSGANANRFLVLDIHTTGPATYAYRPLSVDLSAFSGTPLSGVALSRMTLSYTVSSPPQFRIFPSPGNGLAFFAYFGTGDTVNGSVQHATIYRSDSGAELCTAANFTPQIQQEAQITADDKAEIIDNTAQGPVASCPLPRGVLSIAPSPQDFGSALPTGSSQKAYTFSNSGNDCLSISAVASAAHFQPVGFNPFNLAPAQNNAVTVSFAPAGAVGSFSEALAVTRTPALGSSSATAIGASCADLGTPTSCGACGHACAGVVNGTPVCTNGTCQIQCAAGYTNCGGTCVATGSDPFNCGACNLVCPGASNGYGTCSSGTCGCTQAPSPTNPSSCGTCGNVCSAQANATATCSNSTCGSTCNAGYEMCNGACWSSATPRSGGNACTYSDCACGTGPDYYCRPGPGECLSTALVSQTFALNQSISFTGTSATTGVQGAFVAVTGASGTFNLPTGRNVQLHFGFRFLYPSGPSVMNVDLIFKIDGVEVARGRFPQGGAQSFDAQVAIAIGTHTLTVEARSVLMNGPPTTTTLSGPNGGPATLAATVIRDHF